MRRLTFSLSETTVGALEALAARIANGNLSLVAEVALQKIIQQPMAESQRQVELHRRERMTGTRSGWMRAFWQTLGESMSQPDAIDNLRAPRTFKGSYAALLMHNIGCEDREDDPFHAYVGPQPVTPESPSPRQWTFNRSTSAVTAAETVALKLREYGTHDTLAERG